MDSRAPTATYRLQLQPGFPFAAAEAAAPHLAALGVSHLHLSPVLEAVPGSTHGYDVTDPTAIREELGGEDALRSLSRTARSLGLGLVVDIVPNHMAMAPLYNRPLWEVLRKGPGSPYAAWFDIDWEAGGGRVLLPVLGAPLGAELPHLRVDGDVLRHHDQAFPLRPGTEDLPLPELLDAQWYRLGWWRLARTELNYRRFFTVSELIGVRVEDPGVFDATHGKILELLDEGVIDGLRIDHPDGLADPGAYLRRLEKATGGRWTVVEKILAEDERLPESWPVAGTTGYDALRRLDAVLTDPDGARGLLDHHRRHTAAPDDLGGDWEATRRRSAERVVDHELAAETTRLTRAATAACASSADPELRDRAPWALRTALRELLVRMEVYRPYTPRDAVTVLTEEAAAEARAAFAVPEEAEAVDVVRGLLVGRYGEWPEQVELCTRFAQTSSALRAKSVEDSAFYRHVPLLSANEVGGSPDRPAVTPEEFHAWCARVQRERPLTGTVLSTHDTKRSADVRAAIAVLSQCPDRWADIVGEATAASTASGGGPDRQLAWAGWQTLFGLGEPSEERLSGALLKHARESGLHTTWTEQDARYEETVTTFVTTALCGSPGERVTELRRSLEPHIRANVLAATLLHLTMPGVPDVYQGGEGEYRALVDPDNRDPAVLPHPDPGVKGMLTAAALTLRRRRPELFGADASYRPLAAEGEAAGHCLAFTRSGRVLTVVTRLSLRLAESGGWGGTELPLPPGRWSDLCAPGRVFEGRVLLADLLGPLPVALLERAEDD
ncbi:malto-oligosyltrehalose synthase [Streptomyces fragilis]|uniref:Malto-oligosyltrehalose synthase n=1 Tax=Streptomyces fragilis TaxID=67301 RepID=A0ABV2YGD9_9ACTN|nr:malto-oligosyltrehalose synthase [Streptomyces fragilis]